MKGVAPRLFRKPPPEAVHTNEATAWELKCRQSDEAFKAAMAQSHPERPEGVHTDPCTERPLPQPRPETPVEPKGGGPW